MTDEVAGITTVSVYLCPEVGDDSVWDFYGQCREVSVTGDSTEMPMGMTMVTSDWDVALHGDVADESAAVDVAAAQTGRLR